VKGEEGGKREGESAEPSSIDGERWSERPRIRKWLKRGGERRKDFQKKGKEKKKKGREMDGL